MLYAFLYRSQQHVTEQTTRVGSYGLVLHLHVGKALEEVTCDVRWFCISDDY